MENPWLDPKFLLPAIIAAIAVIAWLIRGEMQSKANTTRQKEFEEAVDERFSKNEALMDRTKSAFYEHKGDTVVHHNAEAFKEFSRGIDRRFNGVEATLQKISDKLDRSDVHKTQG